MVAKESIEYGSIELLGKALAHYPHAPSANGLEGAKMDRSSVAVENFAFSKGFFRIYGLKIRT